MKYIIKVKSFNNLLIKKGFDYLSKDNNKIDIKLVGLPTEIKKFTLIKSPHVHKKSREQYESRTYKSLIIIKGLEEDLTYFLENKLKTMPYSLDYTLKLSY